MPTPQEGIHIWYSKLSHKSMAEEVIGSSRENAY